MESSPPIVEMIALMDESANAFIRSSALAFGYLCSHSASRKECAVSTTFNPNSSCNCLLPASYRCGKVPGPPQERLIAATVSPGRSLLGLITVVISLLLLVDNYIHNEYTMNHYDDSNPRTIYGQDSPPYPVCSRYAILVIQFYRKYMRHELA